MTHYDFIFHMYDFTIHEFTQQGEYDDSLRFLFSYDVYDVSNLWKYYNGSWKSHVIIIRKYKTFAFFKVQTKWKGWCAHIFFVVTKVLSFK